MKDLELLTSTQAARLLGVGPSTVKRWADQGRLPFVRTLGKHRRFRVADVRRAAREASRGAESHCSTEASEWVDLLLDAKDHHSILARLLELRGREGNWWAAAEVLGKVLVALGARWEGGGLSIAEEHFASQRLARGLARCAESLPVTSTASEVILVCAEGDTHTLGLSLLEVAFRERGWRTRWLGRDTSTETLLENLRKDPPAMVAISASIVSSNSARLRRQACRLAEAAKEVGADLVLGGSGQWPTDIPNARRLTSIQELGDLLG